MRIASTLLILEKIHVLPIAEVEDLGRGTEVFGPTGVIGNVVCEEKPVDLIFHCFSMSMDRAQACRGRRRGNPGPT